MSTNVHSEVSSDFERDVLKAVATLVGCSVASLGERSIVEVQRAVQYIVAMIARSLGSVVGKGVARAVRDLFEVWIEVDPQLTH
eukprot:SAG11_NODE_30_length_23132_cov_22.413277_15_plen_84_part_00